MWEKGRGEEGGGGEGELWSVFTTTLAPYKIYHRSVLDTSWAGVTCGREGWIDGFGEIGERVRETESIE